MDPIITAGLITAGSNLLGNSMNVNAQNTANRENAELARENRDWQKMMSDTSHQREMKDLAAAGLNPILAAGGGASTPGGDSATMEAPQVQMPSVMEIAALSEQKKNNESLRNLQAAQAEQIRTQTRRGEPMAEIMSDVGSVYKKGKEFFKYNPKKSWLQNQAERNMRAQQYLDKTDNKFLMKFKKP